MRSLPCQNCLFRISFLFIILAALLVVSPAASAQAGSANNGFVTIKTILDRSCAGCHDWTASYETIVADGKVVPGSPEKSILYQKIASDEMPAEGEKLSADEKAYIRGWISAGAPSTDLPIAVPAVESPAAGGTQTAAPSPGFNKVLFHEVTGFTSTAMLAAAGVIGVVHFLDMMQEGHRLRDLIGYQESQGNAVRAPYVQQAWASDSALRWWHVGLLVGGEALYLGDAVTGISMWTRSTPGRFTKHDLHRVAFFTHAGLMIAQVVLGFLTTDALSRGDHDQMIAVGAAHAAVGVAIPVVMLGAGLENIFLAE
jgi:hypothetical protein